jgi:hypothetical protein
MGLTGRAEFYYGLKISIEYMQKLLANIEENPENESESDEEYNLLEPSEIEDKLNKMMEENKINVWAEIHNDDKHSETWISQDLGNWVIFSPRDENMQFKSECDCVEVDLKEFPKLEERGKKWVDQVCKLLRVNIKKTDDVRRGWLLFNMSGHS